MSGTTGTHRADASPTTVDKRPPDLSEFASLTKGQGAKCAFGPSLSTLTDTDRSALDAVLVDLSYQATAIVRWLARRDILTTKTTVARHRPRHGDPIECVTCRT